MQQIDAVAAAAPEKDDALLDESEAARRLSLSPSTLNRWRMRGAPALPFVKLSRCVRYRPADIAAFISNNTVRSTGGLASTAGAT